MKRRKSLLFIGAAVVCSLPLGSKADFSGFIDQLRDSNIPIDTFLTQTGVTRYELARLLNTVECKDCINPDTSYLKAYTAAYWANFIQIPGKDFKDISYLGALFNTKSYYYCVAYAGDNSYMKGYPLKTSNICPGEFCGDRYTSKAEFLQVVINLISKYIYPLYSLNWSEANTRISGLKTTDYEYKTFSVDEIGTINSKAKTCKNQSCVLENTDQLSIYLKYCMFNLKSCGMTAIGLTTEGYWPVAELNILSKQKILTIDEAATYNIRENIDGGLLTKIFGNINSIIGCTFNNDYDCDGIPNSQDSCPNAYNPNQTDTDKDGIGDVCDADIDGDGIKNPIGIVDDNGRIDIQLWTPTMDNCLFVINKDQTKTNNAIMGDACSVGENLSLAISLANIHGDLPQNITFKAIHTANFTQYSWDLGDGSFTTGEIVTHTYTKPGIYLVRLLAKTSGGKQSMAKTTIVVGRLTSEERALQPLIKTVSVKKDDSVDLPLSEIGKVDSFEWSFSDGSTGQTTNPNIKKIFRTQGSVSVIVKGIINKQIASVNAFTLGIENGKGAILKASLLNPDKNSDISFSTTIAGFLPKDVRSVGWDFGDGTTIQTQELSINHTYKISGQKVVIQNILLNNGSSIRTIITLYVVRPYIFDSYSLEFLPDMQGSSLKPLKFTTTIKGSFDTPLFFTNTYGDSQSQNFGTKNIRSPFSSQHRYFNPGIFYPQTTLMLDACTNLSAQATIDIGGSDLCLEAKINGTLNKLGCDMDKDGIPDICDTDIDGDGKPNLLGLITDPKQCNYTTQIQANGNGTINKDGSINYDILNKHFQGVCSLDNNPFQANPDQIDTNNNNIGDGLDVILNTGTSSGNTAILNSFLDSDNDGIPDNQDLCPLLPETYNGIQDTDGCPEIGVELNCENSQLPTINGDWTNGGASSCGNGLIDAGESCTNCPADAGVCSIHCGNGTIDPGETCQTCPSDVGFCNSTCGNGKQEVGETCINCPIDVPSCISGCGNGKIDPGETCQTCPSDVGSCNPNCGNNKIDIGETCQTCPSDVGSCNPNCGNGKIDPGETCQICPSDVGSCISICGNGKQEVGETCQNCPADVKSCSSSCGNGTIDPGETCLTCPADVESCISQCGNGKQEVGETCKNCPADVKSCSSTCGNGVQEAGETCKSCPADGKYCDSNCGNNKIDEGETCLTCPVDVQLCFSQCGNGIQDPGETCKSCPADGKYCDPNCGNNKIDEGETCQNCPIDVQLCFSQCGNGSIESNLGEQCDNGFLNNGKDGKCSNTCTIQSECGNGKIDKGETCQTCPGDVQLCFSQCGNGLLEPNLGEQCDNGLINNGKDGKCGLHCTAVNTCGNGVQEAGEDYFTCPQDSQGCLLIVAKECLQCPCPFADFSANLTNGDQIKAVLWDISKKYPWAYSVAYEIGY
ncbi:MAG: PKD domain-containing protein [Candidatus Absconditabacteria bacterium]